MTHGNCKFCGKNGKLIRAHIIPRSLYPIVEEHGRRKIMTSSNPSQRPIQLHNGLYDDRLVCGACEQIWDRFDAYAKEFYVDDFGSGTDILVGGRVKGVTFEGADPALLKLFFMSLLWRCHATDRPEFEAVNIGRLDLRLKELLKAADPGSLDEFSVVLQERRHPSMRPMMFNPARLNLCGRNTYELSMFGHAAYIKVDSQRWPDVFRRTCLAEGRPLMIPVHDLSDPKSAHMQLARKIILKSEMYRRQRPTRTK